MSFYADYLKEREGVETVTSDYGFATYRFNQDAFECYIVDIYVVPDMRKDGHATELADTIAEIAQKNECYTLIGSVDLRTETATQSIHVLIHYGMKVRGMIGDLLYFSKDI